MSLVQGSAKEWAGARWLLGDSRTRNWPLAVLPALLAMTLLAGGLVLAKSQGESALATIQPALGDQRLEMARSLTRLGALGEVDLSAVLALPQYLRAIGQERRVREYAPEGDLVFFLTEDTHADELPPLPQPLLRMDGKGEHAATTFQVVTEGYHHRVSLAGFPGRDASGQPLLEGSRWVELAFGEGEAAGNVLRWELPIALRPAEANQPLTPGLFLALFAGLLASMWPCLFQLTAYFIPALAGLSLEQIEGKRVAVAARLRVVNTALFFVLGFTIVYTVMGGIAGYVGSSLGSTAWIDAWRRPVSAIAGVILILLAIRVAANARAPLACRMPTFWPDSKGGTGPLGTMLMGLLFASGCMTCFGAAVLIGLVTYVGSAGSALLGAGLLFLFSLGIGVPLVIAAVAMARVVPLLGQLERLAPYLALGSSLIMVLFGVLMITNQMHTVSGLVYQSLPAGQPVSTLR